MLCVGCVGVPPCATDAHRRGEARSTSAAPPHLLSTNDLSHCARWVVRSLFVPYYATACSCFHESPMHLQQRPPRTSPTTQRLLFVPQNDVSAWENSVEHPPNLEDDPKTIGFWQLCSNFFRIEAFWVSWDTGVIGDCTSTIQRSQRGRRTGICTVRVLHEYAARL